MTLATSLLRYVVATAVLAGGLAGGVSWLIRTDGAPSAQAKPAPLPPRIAESIERKKVLRPDPPVVSLTVPAKPVMQEANVALRPEPAPRQTIRELARVPQKKMNRPLRVSIAPPLETRQPGNLVTTARTDVPY